MNDGHDGRLELAATQLVRRAGACIHQGLAALRATLAAAFPAGIR